MFLNRRDAGEKLALALEKYRNKNALVLGIPRGGAETAYYVARYLDAELSLVITRKLGFPSNPELAFGAVAEDGSLYISDLAHDLLTEEEMSEIKQKQQKEIKRRIEMFRNGMPLPEIKGRIVIIVDDGIATGATVFATIELCKKSKALKIIVAAPISGNDAKRVLSGMVDEVVILEVPDFYTSVSQGYQDFNNLTDEEAAAFMKRWTGDFQKTWL